MQKKSNSEWSDLTAPPTLMENYYSHQFYVQNKDTTRQDGRGKQNYAKYAAYLLLLFPLLAWPLV